VHLQFGIQASRLVHRARRRTGTHTFHFIGAGSE